MAARGSSRAALIGGILAAGLMAGCAAACVGEPGPEQREDAGEEPGAPAAEPEPPARLTVFADKAFYRQREEPEETLRGVLRRVEVRLGPDTREHPFRLELDGDAGELGLYTSGFDETSLRPLIDRRVEIRGKRIDLRPEGFEVEIWMATIGLARPSHQPPDAAADPGARSPPPRGGAAPSRRAGSGRAV